MTKGNVALPMTTLFLFVPAYMLFHVFFSQTLAERWPQSLQRHRWLYRSGNYWIQATHNANPDNFWDSRHNCWTTDPMCGLDVGPKRPWEDLKDVKKSLANKLERDVTRSARGDTNGIKGY